MIENEIQKGERFEFGKNWTRFLSVLSESRIKNAENSLKNMLGLNSLEKKTFLDIGSGSGLFSLAARNLGANVYSFDYDPKSVACTAELKKRYYPKSLQWHIEQGSALDAGYLKSLKKADIVYSWGVLHHTGNMWKALDMVSDLSKKEGLLYVALYNDQGFISKYWTFVKRLYNKNIFLKYCMIILHWPYLFALRYVVRWLTGRLQLERGMSLWHDMIDWLGGYPFEVAKPDTVCEFFQSRGFKVMKMKTCGRRMGCNEFVFERIK